MTVRTNVGRFQLKAEVLNALDRPSDLLIGIEDGKVITRTPPGEGYTMSQAQCLDLVEAYTRALEALHSREEQAGADQQTTPRA